eukprot:1379846-Pyramimonas_sp.AAC.1
MAVRGETRYARAEPRAQRVRAAVPVPYLSVTCYTVLMVNADGQTAVRADEDACENIPFPEHQPDICLTSTRIHGSSRSIPSHKKKKPGGTLTSFHL